MPEGHSAYLDAYEPEKVSSEAWAATRATHREMMLLAGIRGEESFKKRSRELAHYLAGRYEEGQSILIGDALTYAAIDEDYSRRCGHLNDASRNDRRSRLRKIAEAVNPGLEALPRAVPLGHQSVKPGYSPQEELTIMRLAIRQRRPTARRNLSAVVGLCGGAGLDSVDLRNLRVRDIDDRDDSGISIDVPGNRSRSVVVRRDYEHLVRAGTDGLRPGDLILGKSLTRRNLVGAVVERSELLGDVPHIEASRLRSTWLSWLMCRPVPLRVILDAAGLKSARTLIDLLPHLPALDLPRDSLRGEGATS
jgi:integrase